MTDSVLIGLIEQSVLADTLPRRRAASILLRAVRGPGLASVAQELATVADPIAASVADEIRFLTARYGLEAR
jgi:hypothetical protein